MWITSNKRETSIETIATANLGSFIPELQKFLFLTSHKLLFKFADLCVVLLAWIASSH